MPATALSRRRPSGVRRIDDMRTFCGFALVGFTNTILPYLVHAANYLIIPFPRPTVLAIELLPAIAVKILFPQLLQQRNIPYKLRPFIFAISWIVTRIVTWATPPNVPPPFRILMTLLAAAASSGTEVSALGMLRWYGQTGLAGWGFGTGLGGIVVAATPVYLTIWKGQTIRHGIGYILTLAAIMVVAFLLVLPSRATYSREADEADTEPSREERHGLLYQDQPGKGKGSWASIKHNLGFVASLISPYMIPLVTAFMAQAIFYPGLSRALGNSVLGDYMHYSAAYGMTFHAGSFLGRSSIMFYRFRRLRAVQTLLLFAPILLILNAYFLFTSVGPFILAFLVGLLGGIAYVTIYATLLEELPAQGYQELSLGTIGAGESSGLLIGGWVGDFFEAGLCRLPRDSTRWCHMPR